MSDKEEKQKITCNMYYGQYAEFLTIYKKKKKGKANNVTENMGSAEKKNVKFLNMLNLICNKRNANANYSGILFLTW